MPHVGSPGHRYWSESPSPFRPCECKSCNGWLRWLNSVAATETDVEYIYSFTYSPPTRSMNHHQFPFPHHPASSPLFLVVIIALFLKKKLPDRILTCTMPLPDTTDNTTPWGVREDADRPTRIPDNLNMSRDEGRKILGMSETEFGELFVSPPPPFSLLP